MNGTQFADVFSRDRRYSCPQAMHVVFSIGAITDVMFDVCKVLVRFHQHVHFMTTCTGTVHCTSTGLQLFEDKIGM